MTIKIIDSNIFKKRMRVLNKFNSKHISKHISEKYKNQFYNLTHVKGTKFYSTNGCVMCCVDMSDCIKNDSDEWGCFPSILIDEKSISVDNDGNVIAVDEKNVEKKMRVTSPNAMGMNMTKIIPSEDDKDCDVEYDLSLYNFKDSRIKFSIDAYCKIGKESVWFYYSRDKYDMNCEIGDCVKYDFFGDSTSDKFVDVCFPLWQLTEICKISPIIRVSQFYEGNPNKARIISANEYNFVIMPILVD